MGRRGLGGVVGSGGGGGGGVTSVGAQAPLASSGGATPSVSAKAIFPMLVFRPGGTTSGNVYATWAALVTAAGTFSGPKTVFVDTSLAGGDNNAHVPPGSWSLGQYYLLGDPNVTALGKGLLFEDGAILSQLPMDCQSLALSSVSNSFVFESDGEFENLILSKNSSIGSANAPFIKMDGSDQIEVQLLEGSSFLNNGAPCVSVTNGAVDVIAIGNALIQSNTLAATGGGSIEIDCDDSSSISTVQSGPTSVVPLSGVLNLKMTGSTPGTDPNETASLLLGGTDQLDITTIAQGDAFMDVELKVVGVGHDGDDAPYYKVFRRATMIAFRSGGFLFSSSGISDDGNSPGFYGTGDASDWVLNTGTASNDWQLSVTTGATAVAANFTAYLTIKKQGFPS